jgi:hypothetical protein
MGDTSESANKELRKFSKKAVKCINSERKKETLKYEKLKP